MRRADFLLEIGCEEIPARMLSSAMRDLERQVTNALASNGLSFGPSRAFGTPRRLAVLTEGVAERQADRQETVTGPPASAALGPDGKPSKAALGFAQKMGVAVSDLDTISTARGDYLGVRRKLAGRTAQEVLCEALPRAVAGMSFPKTMRWGDGSRRFVRPVHWIVALLGPQVVPLELLGIRAGRLTLGHRTLGARQISLGTASDYVQALEVEGIVVDREERRRALSRRVVELAGEDGVRPVEDQALLEEVADLVEHPGCVLGEFPAEFLELPREILVTTLRHHQKSFSTETDEGLASRFLVVADRCDDPKGHIRRGNEWVVMGRLEDARFFFHEDRKVLLSERRGRLEHVTFHAQAGSYADKSRRLEELALDLVRLADGRRTPRGTTMSGRADGLDPSSGRVGPQRPAGSGEPGPGAASTDPEVLRQAARLAKCDLTSGLVGEFPELQGIAGGLYLRLEHEEGRQVHARGVAEAVYDHYRPAGSDDALPGTREGAVLALADRLDTLVALSRWIGLPSGSKDPFGLRRAAYGVVRLAAETPVALACEEMVASALGALSGGAPASASNGASSGPPRPKAQSDAIVAFVLERFEFWLKEKGCRYDTINAVFMGRGTARAASETLPRLADKVFALERIRDLPDLAALVEIHKRCRNILLQAESVDPGAVLEAAVKEDREEATALAELVKEVEKAEREVREAMAVDDFEASLQRLVRLRPALTQFFDHVLVMHPAPPTRAHRLDLVRRTAAMIEQVADLKRISIPRDELQRLLAQITPAPDRHERT